jgi:hypothetical protein
MAPTAHPKSLAAADQVGAPVRIGAPDRIPDPEHGGRAIARDTFQPVLTIRGCVEPSAVPRFIHEALDEIRVYIEDHGIHVRGEPFSICHSVSARRVDVEAGWPVEEATGTERISSGAMPPCLVRSSRRHADPGDAGGVG